MPIKRRVATPPPKQARSPIAKASTSPFLSAEEKHQLILAHAAARRPPPDPGKRLSMWAGVIVCMVLIATGWTFTVGSGIKKLLAAPMALELTSAAANLKKLKEPTSMREDKTNLVGALKKATEESETQREALLEILMTNMAKQATSTSVTPTSTLSVVTSTAPLITPKPTFTTATPTSTKKINP